MREMEHFLSIFVKDNIYEGSPLLDFVNVNRLYYPARNHIQQHMLEYLHRNKKSRIDQDCLKAKIEEWIRENDQ